MEILNVLVATIGAFAFGAVWYTTMSKPWMDSAGIECGADGKPVTQGGMAPFVIGFTAMVIVAGMMRHVLAGSGVVTVSGGIVSGLGIGAFFIVPWVAMNYAFAGRPLQLTAIDGVNSIVGCAIMGAILNLF
jgi:hypothetical protein